MVNVDALKAEMVRNGYNQKSLAEAIGISSRTLHNKLKNKEFGSKEMEILIKVLKLKDPASIFFAG